VITPDVRYELTALRTSIEHTQRIVQSLYCRQIVLSGPEEVIEVLWQLQQRLSASEADMEHVLNRNMESRSESNERN